MATATSTKKKAVSSSTCAHTSGVVATSRRVSAIFTNALAHALEANGWLHVVHLVGRDCCCCCSSIHDCGRIEIGSCSARFIAL